ncbi:hypothetical protein K490DRAFT_35941, partial [Saccharata proteae CBS 121410]
KTPFKLTTSRKPSLAYLYKIGSIAYIHKVSSKVEVKKDKLNTRVHVGYLVRFEGSTIYRI